jgi:hypothetical protein
MQVFLTVDVEAHRVIDEISGERHDSLQCLLTALRTAGLTATFFVDLCAVRTWGQPFMRRVCERIREAGQDLQLHAHPHHFTQDASRWQLGEYTRAEQAQVLDYAWNEYVQVSGMQPAAFRAGGFGLDEHTFALLKERGLALDCSVMYRWPGCKVTQEPIGVPGEVHGIRELPMTPVVTLGTRGHAIRVSSIDFNWLPLFVLKRILRRLRQQDVPAAVVLLHSSSMLQRVDAKNFAYREKLNQKFVQLLAFLKEESFEVTTIADAARTGDLWNELSPRSGMYVESNLFVQYWILLFQSYAGQGFKPKFRAFLFLNALFWAALLLWLAQVIL